MGALTVVSWNVLAQAYVRREYYPHTPAQVLEPARRRSAVLARIAAFDTDVICLQEVEQELFDLAAARLHGYSARFVQKRGKPDGCAMFVRGDAPEWRELFFGDGSGHVALAAVLPNGVAIACTHLKWFPPATPIASQHGRAELLELLDAWVRPGASWIVTGDLNAEADSDVIAVATDRGLHDAYAAMPDAYTCNSNACPKRIDYFLATADLTAEPAPLPLIHESTPLPSADEPSDHLAIKAVVRGTSARVSTKAPSSAGPTRARAFVETPFGRFLRDLPITYFRATLEGQDHVPRDSGALLVGNHALLGLDAFVLAALVLRDTSRYVRFLGEKNLWSIPGLGRALTSIGAVPGVPGSAVALLEAGELVGVYPGGADDSFKLEEERYRLKWGTRAGFARVAMRAKVPIVPVAGLGIDEMYRVVGREPWIGRRIFGSPRYDIPIAFGVLGTLIPHRVTQRFVALSPIDTHGDPDRPEDVERVRAATETALDEKLREYCHTSRGAPDTLA